MSFNSFEFALFLPIVYIFYWYIVNKNLWLQNLLLLIASYIFYGWWDWRFLSLIFISSITDYTIGLYLHKTESDAKRKFLLCISLLINLSLLGFFKYFNFFVENLINLIATAGISLNSRTLSIILPVGISFYTFQTLSYTIDIYRKKFEPTKDIIAFLAFVSFFPQLVAGPIERATNLLPQFQKKRIFEYHKAKDGIRQILWGLCKKILIADSCAVYVDQIFSNYNSYSGGILLLGGVYFAFQVYGDFSGYSDIAIGASRLFGFSIMRNFTYPFFSRNIAEFWKRWHISLTTWFRDYLYIPLGGSRGSIYLTIRNVLIIFFIIGFWHGANWNFICWGTLNGIYFIPLLLLKKNRNNNGVIAEGSVLPSIKEFFQIIFTFLLFISGLIIFRTDSLHTAIAYFRRLFSISLFSIPEKKGYLPLIFLFIIWEWIQRDKAHGLEFKKLKVIYRWLIYTILIMLILYFSGEEQQFFYFQF